MRLFPVALGLILVPGLAAGQSLGDAAAKERERRRKLQETGPSSAVVDADALKAGKGTLANDPRAVPSSSPTPAKAGPKPSPSPSPRPASAVPPLITEAPASEPDNTEAAWRERASDARDLIELWQKRYDYWSSLNLPPGDYFVDEDGRKLVGSAENLQQIVARAKAQLDAAKQAFEDLETRARRQSVPPGWLR
jgi:hypothetical protein